MRLVEKSITYHKFKGNRRVRVLRWRINHMGPNSVGYAYAYALLSNDARDITADITYLVWLDIWSRAHICLTSTAENLNATQVITEICILLLSYSIRFIVK